MDTDIRLSVAEQLALELLLETSYTGKPSWRQSLVIEAFRPWLSPSRVRLALKRLEHTGLIRQVRKSPVTYAVSNERAHSVLSEPKATLAGGVYRLVALMSASGGLYVERSVIDALPAPAEAIDSALERLVAEQLLTRGSGRYYLYFSDGVLERELARALDDMAAFIQEDEWLSGVVFGAREIAAPGHRTRPSGLAERLVSA